MTQVNHPSTVGDDNMEHITESGLIPESVSALMQDEAVAEPPKSQLQQEMETQPTTVKAAEAPVVTNHATRSCHVKLLVNVVLTDMRFAGTKSALQSVDVPNSESVNLYSPFKKAPKPDQKGAVGVLRDILYTAMYFSQKINDSKLVFLGKPAECQAALRNSIEGLRHRVADDLMISGDTEIVKSLEEEEEDNYSVLCFKDMVRLSSWVNFNKSKDPIVSDTAVLNLTTHAGILYDAEDRIHYITQLYAILKGIMSSNDLQPASLDVVLGLTLNPTFLREEGFRVFMDMLLSDSGYHMASRSELLSGNADSWLPDTKIGVERDLLVPNGDLFFYKDVTNEVA